MFHIYHKCRDVLLLYVTPFVDQSTISQAYLFSKYAVRNELGTAEPKKHQLAALAYAEHLFIYARAF